MSKTPWTPGPWRVECGTSLIWGDCKTVDKDGYDRMGKPVAEVKHTAIWARERDVMQPQEQGANARLIAAAPEMAETLSEIYRTLGHLSNELIGRIEGEAATKFFGWTDANGRVIAALLARVRGEAQS